MPPAPQVDDEPAKAAAAAIAALNAQIAEVARKQAAAQAEADSQRARARAIEDVLQRVAALKKLVDDSREDLTKRLAPLGLKLGDIVQLTVNTGPLANLQETTKSKLAEQQAMLHPGVEGTLPSQLTKLRAELATE